MKTKQPTPHCHTAPLAALLAAVLSFGAGTQLIRAQDAAFGPGTGGGPEMRGERGGPGPDYWRGGANLTEEERQILRAAHEKVKNDPELERLRKAAREQNEAVRQRTREALVKADPRVGPILEKAERNRPTPEQMRRMREVMEKVKDDPAVAAAREKMKAAKTPEERKAAAEELRAARKTAVAKIDPELAEKMPLFPPKGGRDDWRKGGGKKDKCPSGSGCGPGDRPGKGAGGGGPR